MGLWVEASIEIEAPPARVWQVLTQPALTAKWAAIFGANGPIDSTWQLGSEVVWRNGNGEVYVYGNVTEVTPHGLLRFTVCDRTPELRPMSRRAEDEITQTYSLSPSPRGTVLSTRHGDFAKLANGRALFPRVEQLWRELLPRLRALAEDSGELPTAQEEAAC